MVFLRPKSVGERQFEAWLVPGFSQLALKLAKTGVDLSLRCAETKDLAHLLFGLAPCAAIGHGQSSGDAVGREEKVPRIGFEPPIQVQGKRRVAFDELLCACRFGTPGVKKGGEHKG